MASVERLVPHILRWEGGFCNDPDDLGGITNKGVTFKTYKLYRRQRGLPIPSIGDLHRLTDGEFTDILKTMYWNPCKADFIENQSVANAIVDWAWHSGTVTAVKEIQKGLGIKSDGIVGNITLSAINSESPLPLFGKIQSLRKAYIERICKARPANNKFKRGWYNRINSLVYEE